MPLGYGDDLAHIHDVGFSFFVEGAIPGVLRILRQNGLRSGRVVELGCGSGRLARALLAAGFEVVGFDISPSMVRLARRNAPDEDFRVQSAFRADLPGCVAVVSVGECLNYAFDRMPGREILFRLFHRVHKVLGPGGVFIFDLAESGQLPPGASRQIHREGGDWATLVVTEEDRRRKILIRRITAFRRVGRWFRRSTETHRLRLYSSADVRRALRRSGFTVVQARAYGRFALPPKRVAFIARKRGS